MSIPKRRNRENIEEEKNINTETKYYEYNSKVNEKNRMLMSSNKQVDDNYLSVNDKRIISRREISSLERNKEFKGENNLSYRSL